MSTVPTRYSPQTNVAAGESGDSSDSEDSRDDNGKPRGQIILQIQFCKFCTTFTEVYNLNLMFLNGDPLGFYKPSDAFLCIPFKQSLQNEKELCLWKSLWHSIISS